MIITDKIDTVATGIETTESPDFYLEELWGVIEGFIGERKKKPSETIYHYTTLEALVDGIIPQEPNSPICLRATHCQYLNDPKEMTFNLNKIKKDLQNIPTLLKLVELSIAKPQRKNKEIDYHLLSFSENADYLPMWGMYAKNGTGISIEFYRSKIRQDNSIALKCLYPNSDEYKALLKLLEAIFSEDENPIRQKFFEKFDRIQYPDSTNAERKARLEEQASVEKCDCLKVLVKLISFLPVIVLPILAYKNPAYEYEREIRLVCLPNEFETKQYRVKDGMIIPYIKIAIPNDAIKTITLGPTHDFERSKKSLDMFLQSRGISGVKIKKSSVPYRP